MRPLPFHPLLVAVFPVLYLWMQNADEAAPGEVLPVLAVLAVAGIALVPLFAWLTRDRHRGALVASLAAFLTLAYGRLWDRDVPAVVGLAATVGAVALAVHLARRVPTDRARSWTSSVNIGATVLVVATVVPIVLAGTAGEAPARAASVEAPGATLPEDARDIYYVILDRYGRDDTLAEVFDHDNTAFTDALEAQGFDVADRSVANYPKTAHSLAASLNLTYLDELSSTVSEDAQDSWAPVYGLLRDHALGRILTGVGYEYVHVGTWWSPTQSARSADLTLNYDGTTEFSRVFTDTTAWAPVQRLLGRDGVDKRVWKREHTLYQLDQLEELAATPADRPRFVFAHLTVPHEPYVFEADGTFVDEDTEDARSREDNYRRQVAYTNARILRWLDELVTGDDATDPIVVVQADEGPHPRVRVRTGPRYRWTEAPPSVLREKLRILNAMRLPGVADEDIPETTTPVNTFRFVLSRYLDADLPPLPDRAFVFPHEDLLYEFVEVTDVAR